MKTVPILFTFDESLLMPAGVCITSLLMNAAPDTFYDIFVLHSDKYDLSGSRLTQLPEKYGNCRITFRKVSNEFVGAYEIRGIPETAYYRLISPELIPEYDKILYSDVDVIFREDLSRFYDIDLGGNYFGAVDNCSAIRPDFHPYIAGLGLDWRDGYFYSGNLIINLELIRKDGLCDRFRELGRNNYKQQDMDIMNIACKGRILPLEPAFCLSALIYRFIVLRRKEMQNLYPDEQLQYALDRGIVHYNGAKPWKECCLNMDIWWDYYRKSPFFDESFTFSFWHNQASLLEKLPLKKRAKLFFKYFIVGAQKW